MASVTKTIQRGEIMKWIDVKDRLPDVEVNVLIVQNYTEIELGKSAVIGHLHQPRDLKVKPYWNWVECDSGVLFKEVASHHRAEFICPGNEYVTHWMPLPEMPKG